MTRNESPMDLMIFPPKVRNNGDKRLECSSSSRWFCSSVWRLVRSVNPLMSVKTIERLAVFNRPALYYRRTIRAMAEAASTALCLPTSSTAALTSWEVYFLPSQWVS